MNKTTIAVLAAALLCAGLSVAAAPPASAGGAVWSVTETTDELDPSPGNDPADLSLREAWRLAATDGGPSTIVLQADATYELTRCGPGDGEEDASLHGDLDGPIGADGDLLVDGRGATIRQTCPQERIVQHHDDTSLEVQDLTLTGGDAPEPEVAFTGGGAISVGAAGGDLRLDRVTVTGNQAFGGGGIWSEGGEVQVFDSTFVGNRADFAGGAVAVLGGELGLVRSTLSGNSAAGFGGAVAVTVPFQIADSTIVANRATEQGVASNLYHGAHGTSRGSIIAMGSGAPDCSDGGVGNPLGSGGGNLDSDGSCFTQPNLVGRHPQLAPLGDHGGPTGTHLPVIGSPALDAVGVCLYVADQRGEPRPQPAGGQCDVGSVEQPAAGCTPPAFPDVGPAHPFFEDVCWMGQMAITTGFSDGRFQPSAAVTRQSMAAFLYRFALSPPFEAPTTPSFIDVGLAHPFFREVEWLADSRIAGGFADRTYRPSVPVTRQAMAAFLFRIGGDTEYEAPAAASYSDVGPGHPFFREVEWVSGPAATSKGYGDGTWRPADPVTRQAMSAFLRRLSAVPNLAGI